MPFAGPDLATHQGRLAVLRNLQGRHDEAVTLAQSSVDGLKTYLSSYVRAQSLTRLGSILIDAHRQTEAVAPLEQSLALFAKSQLPGSPDQAETRALLARVRSALKP